MSVILLIIVFFMETNYSRCFAIFSMELETIQDRHERLLLFIYNTDIM